MYKKFIKPLFDLYFSILLIVIFLPLMILTSVIIYITMKRPILFKQDRPGLNEKIFKIYKFKTMSDERDKNGELLPDEDRLKGVGKIIRKLSLDELPQLFNILKGDMSFIGPRPLLVEYLPLYDDNQKKRHNIKPGITGWAQVNGRNTISWEKKFEYDLYYVENISFLLDLKIIIMTIYKVFKQDDISSYDHVTMEKFQGSLNDN